MIVSKKSLSILRTQLPENWAATLEKKFPIGRIMLRAIMRGDYADNHGVIEAAVKLRDDHAKKEKKRKEKLMNAIHEK